MRYVAKFFKGDNVEYLVIDLDEFYLTENINQATSFLTIEEAIDNGACHFHDMIGFEGGYTLTFDTIDNTYIERTIQ